MHTLTSLEQFDQLIAAKADYIIFKHSTRCSISDGACREVYQAIDELQIDAVYLLDVLTTGDLKYDIADKIKVKHQSPQVLIFKQGLLTAQASHGTISKGRIINQLNGRHDTRQGGK